MNKLKKLSLLVVMIVLIASTLFAQEARKQSLADDIGKFTTSILSNPGDAKLYIKRAEAGYELNSNFINQSISTYKLKHVIEDANKSIELAPKNASYYSNRANYKKLIYNDLEGAAKDMGMAIELEPKNPQWYLNRTNYVNILAACKDWQTCAGLGDARCKNMYEQICKNQFDMKEEPASSNLDK